MPLIKPGISRDGIFCEASALITSDRHVLIEFAKEINLSPQVPL